MLRALVLGALAWCSAAGGAQASVGAERKPLIFVLPDGAAEGWVRGNLSFPPSVLHSYGSLRLYDFKAGREVPVVVLGSRAWFDGSVMVLDLGFKAARLQERRIWAEWGSGIRGTGRPGRLPRGARPVEFRVFEEGDDVRMQGEVNVGTLVVRVERHAGVYYWWYLAPILGIVGFVLWRKWVLRRG